MICDEDCLNCKYTDCIIIDHNLKSLRLIDKRKHEAEERQKNKNYKVVKYGKKVL